MNVSLINIISALETLGVDTQNIHDAINALNELLIKLDDVEVKGRQKLDTLLGCMMAIDAIIGNKRGGDENG